MYHTIKKAWTVIGVLAALLVFASLVAPAKVSANQLTFSVTPQLPDNQINKEDGYFNLKLSPGETQDLILRYANNTKKKITVTGEVARASTNNNGVVEYGKNKIKADSSLTFDMAKLVSLPENVELQPGEEKDVVVHVEMPNVQYKGIIAGGLTFSDKEQDALNKSKSSKGMVINNLYAFQLGLLMRQSSDATYTSQQIQEDGLELTKVKPTQVNYRNVISANLRNPLGVYLNDLAVYAKITPVASKKVEYESKNNLMQMAPNTNFNYPIPLGNGTPMKPGKYTLTLEAFGQNNDQGTYQTSVFGKKTGYDYKWHFTKEFTITGKTAKLFNAKDVTIKRTNWPLLIGLLLLLVLLSALLFWLFFMKRRRDDKMVEIEEVVLDATGNRITITRETTQSEYRKLLEMGREVSLVKRNN